MYIIRCGGIQHSIDMRRYRVRHIHNTEMFAKVQQRYNIFDKIANPKRKRTNKDFARIK